MRTFVCSIALCTALGCDPANNGAADMTVTSGLAVVTSRDSMNMGGAINTVTVGDKVVARALDTTIDADNSMRFADGKVYLLNRIHNNLRVYDMKTWKVLSETALPGMTSYPQDAYPLPGSTKVYVTFAGNMGATAIGVLDTATPQAGVTASISVPVIAADIDGKPEPSTLYFCKGLFYTGLGDYDSASTFAPLGPGRIAVIDPTQNKTTDVIQLAFQNPTGMVAAGDDCATVLVSGSGPFGVDPNDQSGVEKIDLAGKKSLGALFDGKKLAGVPGTVVRISATRAVMVVNYDLQTVMGPTGGYKILARSRLVSFDPSTGTIAGDASEKAGYIAFLGLSPSGELWFGADNLTNVDTTGNLAAGLYVGADGAKIGGKPIDIGQTPYAIIFP